MPMRKDHGFALLDLIFACGLIGLLCSIAVPRFLLAEAAAGAASAIGSLRAINSAQLTFALSCGAGFYAPDLPTLGTRPPGSNEGFISESLGRAPTVTRSGYTFQMTATGFAGAPGSCNGLGPGAAGQGFKAAADALEPANLRFFGTNANDLIWENTSTLFAAMPETGEPPIGHPLER